MATLLDDQLVTDAMENLDEWSGDAKRISRTVRVDDVDALLAAVGEAADAMDHHPEVERDGEAATFTLWTHSAGGVTELDIALASRINDLVLAAQHIQRDAQGELHSVAGAQTDEGSVEGRTTTAEPNLSDADDLDRRSSSPADVPTMNEPSTPRQDAGAIVAPDAEPGSIEPQPGNAPAPGMHERTETPDA
jgi:4a-hydroxytetrahydrobiopterin dehydratase